MYVCVCVCVIYVCVYVCMYVSIENAVIRHHPHLHSVYLDEACDDGGCVCVYVCVCMY
jgi:hypothetical protein